MSVTLEKEILSRELKRVSGVTVEESGVKRIYKISVKDKIATVSMEGYAIGAMSRFDTDETNSCKFYVLETPFKRLIDSLDTEIVTFDISDNNDNITIIGGKSRYTLPLEPEAFVLQGKFKKSDKIVDVTYELLLDFINNTFHTSERRADMNSPVFECISFELRDGKLTAKSSDAVFASIITREVDSLESFDMVIPRDNFNCITKAGIDKKSVVSIYENKNDVMFKFDDGLFFIVVTKSAEEYPDFSFLDKADNHVFNCNTHSLRSLTKRVSIIQEQISIEDMPQITNPEITLSEDRLSVYYKPTTEFVVDDYIDVDFKDKESNFTSGFAFLKLLKLLTRVKAESCEISLGHYNDKPIMKITYDNENYKHNQYLMGMLSAPIS